MKRIIAVMLASLMLVFCLTACESKFVPPTYDEIDMSTIDSLDDVSESKKETDYVMIKVKDYGSIVVHLFPNVAPATVENFKKLVSDKFYDGLIFHRVINGFMIQGGDPEGTGYGGSPDKITGEFSSNGFENNLPHIKGVISMARNGFDMNSASSQFFICQNSAQCANLNGDYAAFGYVVYGIDVVDSIAGVDTNSKDKPLTAVVIESIRFVKVD
jgi:peptidyl-prolyl cis-trans isomerase B (cyclophilin B)